MFCCVRQVLNNILFIMTNTNAPFSSYIKKAYC
jgi:hypothetical protein